MDSDAPPVAIWGVGGSGTRIVAAMLREFGYYIGDDLNNANDNLWFTLLFKRRSVLLDSYQEFHHLFTSFQSKMTGGLLVDAALAEYIMRFAANDRIHHPKAWLKERVTSFVCDKSSYLEGQRWGWKEPNTHVVIDRLLLLHPQLHYVHVVRNPFYMSTSKNQNQLQNWGAILLDREVKSTRRDAFAFWCRAHQRLEAFISQFPGRITILSYDRLCLDPQWEVRNLAEMISLDIATHTIDRAASLVTRRPQASEQNDNYESIDKNDIAFAKHFLANFF